MLITGVAGVAGYNALDYFGKKFPDQVIGTRRVDNWRLQGESIRPLNAYDAEGMKRLFDEYEFASVLNCEGTCRLKSCEYDPENARRINVESVNALLGAAPKSTRIVSLSIDLVYSGTGTGNHTEEDPTDPVTVYGETMVDAEQMFLSDRPDACILRISLPMGISFNGHAGAIDWIGSRFAKSRPATLYYDEVRTPTYTDCLNGVFEAVLGSDLSGIYHAGAPRQLSLYEIGQVINRLGGYDADCLMGRLRGEAGPIPPRAGNVTLDSSKLREALGHEPLDPWPVCDQHVPTHHDWHRERPTDEPGSMDYLLEVLAKNPRVLRNAGVDERRTAQGARASVPCAVG
jgi:dTDP-4-dehydrorhamnose reductase